MAFDHARSDNPVLDRLLIAAGQQRITGVDLSLDRINRLLSRMASPHLKLAPVFHVAGTNGKGSTVAFLRAALEAAGHQVHVFTSPHLVRVNERIRIAGQLVSDEDLAEALAEVLRFNAGQPLSFFEVLTAAALLLFAANPADAVILETGLGGRLDSTNVIPEPAVTGISQIAIDHEKILGPTIRHIAAEKAGIAKRGVPLVTQNYPQAVAAAVREVAQVKGARLMMRGESWEAGEEEGKLAFRTLPIPTDEEDDPLLLPLPKLAGGHQINNAALAIAMLKAQQQVTVSDGAMRSAMGWAQWPARLQRIQTGPLFEALPKGSELWLDSGHNPAASRAVATWLVENDNGLPLHLVSGLLGTKDYKTFFKAFQPGTPAVALPIPGHESVSAEELATVASNAGLVAATAEDVVQALQKITRPSRVLIMGSIYLAGEFLRINGPLPQ